MTLTELAIDKPEAFVSLCDKLRRAGVVKLGALVLGPLPREAMPTVRDAKDPDAEARRKHEVMFAACRTRPPFEPRVVESDTPRAVVQRRQRDEAPDGKAVTKR